MIWSTFSGIGGLDLGLEMAGFPPPSLVCEWEPWNRALLAQRYPNAIQHTDITTLEAHHGPPPFLISGGFPCQDISVAGAQAGLAGEKSGLWWELARVIAATRPRFVVLENVAAILSDSQPVVPPRAEWLGDAPAEPLYGAFGAVLWTLAALGYDATWDCVPAGALGAPHRRDRWFLVAYPNLRDGRWWTGSAPRNHAPRHDAGRAEGHCGATCVRGAALAYASSSQPQRHGAPGQVAGAPEARDSKGAERERVRNAAGCGGSGMANASSSGLEGQDAYTQRGGPQRAEPPPSGIWRRSIDSARAQSPWTYLPRVGGVAHGLPAGVDRPRQPWEQGELRTKPHQAHWKQRLKGLGNAVVPVAGMVPGLVVRELMDLMQP